MRTFFFGVISPNQAGHFLWTPDGKRAPYRHPLPFKDYLLDGCLLPPNEPQTQAKLYIAHINGWTILSCWDRTGDERGNSNASFLFEGVWEQDQAEAFAQHHYQTLWQRIVAPFLP